MNDFHADLSYSLEEQENELFDRFYHRVFPGIDDIELVKDMERQKKGIDKVIRFKSGDMVTIDEKKRRKWYGDILLELWSVWEQRKRGWLYTCQCDYIVYVVMPTKTVYLLPSLLLKKVWVSHQREWMSTYKELPPAKNKGYITRNIAIPVDVLLGAIINEMKQPLLE